MQGVGPHSLQAHRLRTVVVVVFVVFVVVIIIGSQGPGGRGRGLDEGDADGDVGGFSSLGRLVAHQVLHHRVFGHVLHKVGLLLITWETVMLY